MKGCFHEQLQQERFQVSLELLRWCPTSGGTPNIGEPLVRFNGCRGSRRVTQPCGSSRCARWNPDHRSTRVRLVYWHRPQGHTRRITLLLKLSETQGLIQYVFQGFSLQQAESPFFELGLRGLFKFCFVRWRKNPKTPFKLAI